MKLRVLLLCLVTTFAGVVCAHGQTVYTWTGVTDDFFIDQDANWLNGTAPVDDVNDTLLVFNSSLNTHVRYYQTSANQITFSGITKSYWLEGNYDTTHIGSGGIVYAPASPVASVISGNVMLEASQTWDIQSGSLLIDGYIEDSGNDFVITKTGAGNLLLPYDSDWTGGFVLSAGSVSVEGYNDGDVTPFGTGTLTFDGGTLIANHPYDPSNSDVVSLPNDIVSHGLIRTINHVPVEFQSGTTLTLLANTSVDTSGQFLAINSNIAETGGPFNVTMNGTGRLVLGGANTYTGGTVGNSGVLIFGLLSALPANPATNALSVAANGYVGLGDDNIEGANYQADFIDRFNKAATFGTIGMDTDPSLSNPTEYFDDIDLTGFSASVKLGSATRAELSGDITPQGSDYRFGGGGGLLQVSSRLTGARNLVVDSPAANPLTLWLTSSSNDFTGTIAVTNSAVVFGDIALPSGSQTITVGAGGYVGTESADSGSASPDDADIAYFLGHITTTSSGMIGFDAFENSNRNLYRDINLSSFTGTLFLGTATIGYLDDGVYGGTLLGGVLTTTNGGADPYRFAGYKGGVLRIESILSGSAGVIIGDPASPATFGDAATGAPSVVLLDSDNSTLTGNITLYAGVLAVSQQNGVIGTNPTSALGTGRLIVEPISLPSGWIDFSTPSIYSEAYQMIIANPVTLNTTLRVNELSAWLQFSGKISGSGGLYVEQNAEVGLLNDTNDFTGGIYLGRDSTLHLGADHAASTGVISFGSTDSTVQLDTMSPVIAGLATNTTDDYAIVLAELTNTVLTLNQSVDTVFRGEFDTDLPSSTDNFRLVKSGSGLLELADVGFYMTHGTVEPSLPLSPEVILQVNQGTVVLDEYTYFQNSTSAIWVHGGTLALDNNDNLQNKVYVDNSGRLQGTGYVSSSATFFNSSVISPGVAGAAQIGKLGFDDLTLKGGAKLEVTIKDPNGAAGEGWDLVSISGASLALHIDTSVTAGTPFTIRLITLDASGAPGTAVGFLNQPYTWTIFDASSASIDFGSGSFDPSVFSLDTSAFSADIGPGNFSLVQNGNLLEVNFMPVPEPSTYVLLGLGLGAVFLRRRKVARVSNP